MKASQKAEIIKAVRTVFSSLDSHLDYIIDPVKPKTFRKIHGGKRFHAQCVKEYAETLLTLAKLL